MKRLPDTELEVMKALWSLGRDVPRSALDHALSSFQWSRNTINTYLTRLVEKGFVAVQRDGKATCIRPWSPGEYLSFDSRSVLKRLYGTPRNFMAALARDGLDRRELDELRTFLEELEGGQTDD